MNFAGLEIAPKAKLRLSCDGLLNTQKKNMDCASAQEKPYPVPEQLKGRLDLPLFGQPRGESVRSRLEGSETTRYNQMVGMDE
jgi:hypothetical protein